MGVDLFNKFYKRKRVMVIGHTGFKGSWLLVWLHKLGARVMGYALTPNTTPSLYNQIQGDTLCQSIIGDIRDTASLHRSMLAFQPDIVFHLAAQPIVRTPYQIPEEIFEVNIIGTANVLDGIRKLSKPCVGVIITSDKVYRNHKSGQVYREDDRLGGYDFYSASKVCAEIVINSYRNSFFNPSDYDKHHKAIASARTGNVIGGGDWTINQIIPDCIRALERGKAIDIRNPQSVCPWQHVLDPLCGYLLLASKMWNEPTKYGGSWNFGPKTNNITSIGKVAKKFMENYGYKVLKDNSKRNSLYEAGLLMLDNSKAKSELGWEPRMNINQIMKMTVKWYKKYWKENPQTLCVEQIKQYVGE